MAAANPVLPGFHPDPSICRVGETFYLATSSFEYFPGLPLYRSENLVDWEPIGHALTRESQLDTRGARASGGIFAPTLRHHDGTVYLTSTNTSGEGHFVVTAKDPTGEWSEPISVDAPTGPFEPAPENPILTHRRDFHHDVHATGHADFVTDADGNWWLVCLGIRPRSGFPGWHHLGRETFLASVSWEDGWPVVQDGELPIDIDAQLPADPANRDPAEHHSAVEHTDTDFSDGRTDEWWYRRTPERECYEFTDDGLLLRGAPATLDEKGTTFICRRQTNLDCRVRTDLAFDPNPGEEAGLALVMDEGHHYEVGVVGEPGGRSAVVRVTIGDATDELARSPVEQQVTLGVDATADSYEFLVGGDPVADARPKYLSTEVAGGFTGVVVGPYATGNGPKSDSLARFERFTYEPADHSDP